MTEVLLQFGGIWGKTNDGRDSTAVGGLVYALEFMATIYAGLKTGLENSWLNGKGCCRPVAEVVLGRQPVPGVSTYKVLRWKAM